MCNIAKAVAIAAVCRELRRLQVLVEESNRAVAEYEAMRALSNNDVFYTYPREAQVRIERLVEQTRFDAYASMERPRFEIRVLMQQMVNGELEPKDFEGVTKQTCAILQKV